MAIYTRNDLLERRLSLQNRRAEAVARQETPRGNRFLFGVTAGTLALVGAYVAVRHGIVIDEELIAPTALAGGAAACGAVAVKGHLEVRAEQIRIDWAESGIRQLDVAYPATERGAAVELEIPPAPLPV